MVKRVRIGGSSAEKSEMPGFIKPQLAFLKAKGEANCGLSAAMLSALQRWFVSGHVDRGHLNRRPQHDVRPFFRVNHRRNRHDDHKSHDCDLDPPHQTSFVAELRAAAFSRLICSCVIG